MKANAHLLPAVDAYIAKSQPFAQPILEQIREAVHAAVPDVEEAMKWSMPFFMYKGIILANMAAFKQHASFGIWKENVMGMMRDNPAEPDKGMGSFGKLTDVKELPKKADLKKLLVEAARKIDSGERDKNWTRAAKAPKPEAEVPPALASALKKNKAAATHFSAMSPSCRREYCEWIADAKRDATRDSRVETAVAWIAEGKKRNWKYENC